MAGKKINREEILEKINTSRGSSKTDQEIYNELSEQYYSKKEVATYIIASRHLEDKSKFKKQINTILSLSVLEFVLAFILTIYVILELHAVLESLSQRIFILFVSALAISEIFAFINTFKSFKYLNHSNADFQGLSFLILLIFTDADIPDSVNMSILVLLVVSMVLLFIIKFILKYRITPYLFPNHSKHISKLKRDAKGYYIFPEEEG